MTIPYDGLTDSYSNPCSWYETYPSYRTYSSRPDWDFTVSEMCCACGGGHVTPESLCVNTDQGEVNADGYPVPISIGSMTRRISPTIVRHKLIRQLSLHQVCVALVEERVLDSWNASERSGESL